MIEDFKNDIIIPLKNTGEHRYTGEGIEQNHRGSKSRNPNNKGISKGDNAGHRKLRKETRSHIYKHHQHNTRDRKQNSSECRKQRKNIKNSKGKWSSNIKRQTYQNSIRLLSRDYDG